MPSNSDVWITGIGTLSPLGSDFSEVAVGLLSGRSAIRTVDSFDVEHHPCRIAGQVKLPACPNGVPPAAYDALSPLDRCTVYCCTQALRDAGLFDNRTRLRVGVALGFAAEWMTHWDTDARNGGDLIHRSGTGRKSTVDTVRKHSTYTAPYCPLRRPVPAEIMH
jgi:3-oxoacyl-(acyl-carrier-protein) synthase